MKALFSRETINLLSDYIRLWEAKSAVRREMFLVQETSTFFL
jgi:hypothetical protein